MSNSIMSTPRSRATSKLAIVLPASIVCAPLWPIRFIQPRISRAPAGACQSAVKSAVPLVGPEDRPGRDAGRREFGDLEGVGWKLHLGRQPARARRAEAAGGEKLRWPDRDDALVVEFASAFEAHAYERRAEAATLMVGQDRNRSE